MPVAGPARRARRAVRASRPPRRAPGTGPGAPPVTIRSCSTLPACFRRGVRAMSLMTIGPAATATIRPDSGSCSARSRWCARSTAVTAAYVPVGIRAVWVTSPTTASTPATARRRYHHDPGPGPLDPDPGDRGVAVPQVPLRIRVAPRQSRRRSGGPPALLPAGSGTRRPGAPHDTCTRSCSPPPHDGAADRGPMPAMPDRVPRPGPFGRSVPPRRWTAPSREEVSG